LTNTGDLIADNITFSTNNADFVITSAGASPCYIGTSFSLNGRASCTFGVNFTPSAPGPDFATLSASASPGGSQSVNLSGLGLVPVMILLANDCGTPVSMSVTATYDNQTCSYTGGPGTYTCQFNLPYGQGTTLTAASDYFQGFTGGCSSSTASCTEYPTPPPSNPVRAAYCRTN
jgi:hypothetical protein